MRDHALLRRSLSYYWRTNAAVVLGVATAVAVLAGSLVVGESVRASLARLALSRLGRTDSAVTSPRPFRQALAEDVAAPAAFAGAYEATASALVLKGAVSRPPGGRRSGGVQVHGVDESFFRFHGQAPPAELTGRGAFLSPALAAELGAAAGDGLIVLVDPTEEIPGSSLFGRRDESGHRLRLTARGVLDRDHLGEFTLAPTSQEVRAVFVPLQTLQTALGLERRANTVLVAARPEAVTSRDLPAIVASAARLDDLGLRVRALPEKAALSVESASAVLADGTVAAVHETARKNGFEARDVLAYLANAIRTDGGAIPYSLVAGLPRETLELWAGGAIGAAAPDHPPVVLNAWAAEDLGASLGDRVTLEYYLWDESGRLDTAVTDFRLAGIVPLAGAAADRDLVPEYPGITTSTHLSDWEPPFPVDLSRIRTRDERYWERHRTTPKAFVPLETAQRLWGHRLGRVSSVRVVPPPGGDLEAARAAFETSLRDLLLSGPARERLAGFGVAVQPVRERALAAARGTTDFGEYFVYFSFFLAVSSLLLAGLFFRLGLEQRLGELGLLRAVGFPPGRLARLFLAEGVVLALAGAALGVLGATLYARLIVLGLETVWAGALATRDLDVHVSARALVLGATGGVLAALVTIALGIRDLGQRSPRALLSGALDPWVPRRGRRRFVLPAALSVLALVLLGGAGAGVLTATGTFFAAGALLLVSALVASAGVLRRRPEPALAVASVRALGFRAASFRPGRSLVCIALVASAAFVIVAVGAFRKDAAPDLRPLDSESGGFTLLATSVRPLHHDLRTAAGRAELGLSPGDLDGVVVARFRRSAGEDASCLNPYRPTRPTVLGAEAAFLSQGRFRFQAVEAPSDAEEENPWLVLERDLPGGVVPVVADGTTLQYVLARKLGDEMDLGDTGVRVRFVAAMRPGLLQSELVTSERHFSRAFPREDGFRFFLLATAPGTDAAVAERLESRLADFGLDVVEAAARLAAYHRVENTYIATFQTLGALGLLLGTVGLAAVLLRNAFERRRELALLTAVGYRASHLRRLVLGENALLLGLGLGAGLVPAMVAIAPALRDRGGSVPALALGGLVAALVGVGIGSTLLAVAVIRRLPLLASLRSE